MTSSETNWHDYIAQYFQERIQEVKDKKLKELDLGYYGDYFYNENSVKVSYDVVWELEQLIDNTKLYIDYDDRKLVELVEVPGDVWELEQLEVLNLSGNKLTSLPESISKLSNLTRLDLSENQLTSLPESISKLSNLTSLDLSSNQLTSLPESISKLSNLTRLDLSENQLTSLPESISKLSNLTRLDLSNNLLISLPESISQLSNLTRLDLHGNLIQIWLIKIAQQGIEGMRKYFQQTQERIQEAKDKNLKQLDLSNCYFSKDSAKLAEIFGYISELEQLEALNLSNNQLTSLPESISKLSNLTELYLSRNQLTSLPESISRLSNLTYFYLSNNQLTSLPASITKLSNLTKLYLNSNQLVSLPESISKLSNLTELYLTDNPLKIPPIEIAKQGIEEIRKYFQQTQERIQEAKDKNLKQLDLSNCYFSKDSAKLAEIFGYISELEQLEALNLSNNQLTSLPELISTFSNLTSLDLSNNQLTSLPESISQLSNLTELSLNSNQLTSLPESISKLSNLTELSLNSNQLTSLPESISKLSNLTELSLNSNQLTSLPESIIKLSNLTELYLSRNQIYTNLPESISKLSNLTKLYLNSNQLTNLPESISKLSNLTKLYLNSNQLTNLPESISKLPNLTKLYLRDNPLETPPIEIAKQGIEAIRKYFQQTQEEGIDYIYEAKLLIVGESGAGKTTLANKVLNQNYQLKDEDITKGIEVRQYNFLTKNQNNFHINIWDFGGQEIYHATHQFFLTKRSLYILVEDTRKEDTDFYYWLNVVELLSDNSPLLIVQNEKQEWKREINQRALQGQFINIKEILDTNLATNRNLEKIIGEIQHHISTLPHIGSALPKTWKKVREALELDTRNYISLTEYLSICEENGFKKREDKLQLSGYLHDLGVCLHFRDDPLLNKTVILKPEWGTAAVYKALNNPTVYKNSGKFTKDDLTNIWDEEKYIDMQDELLQLMIKFRLCYKIPGNSQTYIAPELLTKAQPEYDWDESNNLILRYTYEFIPKGIITQFIVVMHQDIEEQKYVWKSGVILQKNQTKAEVIEYYDKREIKIRISGEQKRYLMTVLTHELDKIHSSYNNRLKYNKLIPCNCAACQNSQNPHFYKFEKLQEWISNGRLKTNCDNKPYAEVNIRSLIDDVIDKDEDRRLSESNHYPNDIYIIDSKDIVIDANNVIGSKTMAKKNVKDQSRNIQNQDGNVTGNALGDENTIESKVTTNPPEPEIEKLKKFGWKDFLTWMQNGQIIYYLISVVIGFCLLIIYPKLFPSGFPKLIEKIQDIFPAPQGEIESDKNQ